MTTRLYHGDSTLTTFEAVVTSCTKAGQQFEVTLDRTAFYPTSGGQPSDTGCIGEAAVTDVIDRGDTDVVHVLARAVAVGTSVTGIVDAGRRRDHMEQHTGQHVLSAAFARVCAAETVGFHMGADVSTVDLAREVTPAEIRAVEETANRVLRETRAVTVRIVPAELAATLALRRESTRSGPLRIVEVDDFDVSACGGTHVSNTGEVGMVVVVASERMRGGSRLSFLCGARACRGFAERRERLAEASRLLGVAPSDIVPRLGQLQHEAREAERSLRELRTELVGHRAAEYRASVQTIGPWRVVLRKAAAEGGELKALAQAVVAVPGLVTVIVGDGSPRPLVVARSADVTFDAGAFVKEAAALFGGRGGGRPELAQGGLPGSVGEIENFVRRRLADGTH